MALLYAVKITSLSPLLILFLIAFLFFSKGLAQNGNEPPKIYATGNQFYCPESEIYVVEQFSIIDPDDTEIETFFIQISSGYINGQDRLKLAGNHINVEGAWSSSTGKLTLSSKNGGLMNYSDLVAAVKDVVFYSITSTISGEKFFSFTIGDANFLPSTGHYYEFISDVGITWTSARDKAELRTYNGLKGYLATIRSSDEAKLSGEQADGAGWIGGSDAQSEGTWKWVTGPDAGTTFWIGLSTGYAPNGEFSFWNTEEPNNLGDEDYAHVTAPNIGIKGSWNDLSNTGGSSGPYQPKGYIVEYGYGGPEDAEDFAAYTRIYTPTIEHAVSGFNCGPGNVLLSAKEIEIDTIPNPTIIQWFESIDSKIPIHTGDTFNPSLTITTNYYVLAGENGCTTGKRELVTASIFQIPDINKHVTLKNCDQDENPNDGFTDFNLNEADDLINKEDPNLITSYYLSVSEAENGINPVISSPFNNKTSNLIFARSENLDGCYSIAEVSLMVSSTKPVEKVFLESCDLDNLNDGKFAFDLTQATDQILSQLPPQNLLIQYYRNLDDAILENNEILPQDSYKNEQAYYQSLYVRIESEINGDCFSLGEFVDLYVYPLPEFEVIPEAVYCQNLDPIVLKIHNPQDEYSYEWKDPSGKIISDSQQVVVSSRGTYTVTGTSETNCQSKIRIIEVKESVIATIGPDDIEVVDGGKENSIRINTDNLGIGDYEFALDESIGPYQEAPFFENVLPGIHTVFVRDKNNCGIAEIKVSVIGYPKFFTPNGDGINDTWQVQGVLFQPESNIYVYDKFGKLLEKINAMSDGWNGIYNGRLMPSTDYWFMVQLEDGRVHKGHFSLIRR